MLARGFALDFKGIDVVVVYDSHLESCMCNFIPMVSAIGRFLSMGSTVCVLSHHQIRSLRSHSFTLQAVLTRPNWIAPTP